MITLKLTRQQIEAILNILARAAYHEVAALIAEIMRQSNAQDTGERAP